MVVDANNRFFNILFENSLWKQKLYEAKQTANKT